MEVELGRKMWLMDEWWEECGWGDTKGRIDGYSWAGVVTVEGVHKSESEGEGRAGVRAASRRASMA